MEGDHHDLIALQIVRNNPNCINWDEVSYLAALLPLSPAPQAPSPGGMDAAYSWCWAPHG